MPKLAVFPKAWLKELCRPGGLSLDAWITMARGLDIDGLELYSEMADLRAKSEWPRWKERLGLAELAMPMLCCSPDFTHPDPAYRHRQIEQQKHWIDLTAALGGMFCRVLSGQRRPGLSPDEGLALASASITACLPYARDRGITLILENHYKDDYWTFPEFAQQMDLFCALVDSIDPGRWPNFGVNYDPSNALLAGDDPLELLRRVLPR